MDDQKREVLKMERAGQRRLAGGREVERGAWLDTPRG